MKNLTKENKIKQIITSLLDTDKYKMTMMQERYFHPNGHRKVRWLFKNRTNTKKLGIDMKKYHNLIIKEIKKQLKMLEEYKDMYKTQQLIAETLEQESYVKTNWLRFFRIVNLGLLLTLIYFWTK